MKNLTPILHSPLSSCNLERVTFEYESGGRILDATSFEFPVKGYCQLVSNEGSGSSTVLKMLAGLRSPGAGSYLLNGEDFFGLSPARREKAQLSIGFAFDQGGLFSNYTLLDNLLLPLNYHLLGTRAEREERARAYLEHFGIEGHADKLPAFVSANVKKACALARSLLLDPRMVLLDNPGDSLDSPRLKKLADLIAWHRTERGLQWVLAASEDREFLSYFTWEKIELSERRLFHRRPTRTGTHAA